MKRTLIALAIILAMRAFAQRAPRTQSFASDFQTVPVMANTTGAGGAVFQTYVSLLNPTAAAFPIDVTFYDAAGTAHNAVITLAAREQKTYTNFLDAVFHATGGGAVTFRSSDSANRFIVSTEIWTANGRYGTPIPAVEFAGTDSPAFAPGITVSTTTRTNIGCFNQSQSANTITARIQDASGTQTLGTVTLTLPANAWTQTAVNTVVANGYVDFTPTEAAVCYAVVIDNQTHDGRYLPAAEYRP